MQYDAPRTKQERPEIQAIAPFEGQEDGDVDLNRIHPGDGGSGSKNTVLHRAVWESPSGDPTSRGHSLLKRFKEHHCREVEDEKPNGGEENSHQNGWRCKAKAPTQLYGHTKRPKSHAGIDIVKCENATTEVVGNVLSAEIGPAPHKDTRNRL